MGMQATESPRRTPINERRSFWIILLIVILLLVGYHLIKNRGATNAKPSRTIPVVTAEAKQSNVPVYLSALGSVTPTYSVTIRTQVNGQLLHVLFKEGQQVKKGDLLAQIDSGPYQALLKQYEGTLTRDQALLANAKIDLTRYQTLWKQNSVAQQTLQTQISLVAQYTGNVQTDLGLIASARVNLAYCNIRSPVDGRVGLRLVDPGNIVQTSDTTGLLIVNTLNPITVVFSIPEDSIPDVVQKFTADKGLQVLAYDRQQTRLLDTGSLLTVDNQIDVTTGTVKLKAQFQNDAGLLFPNQFVNIQVLIKTLLNATVVPTAAVQYSSKGPFTYVLNENQTVTMTSIKTGITSGNGTVILSGLKPGQTVIVEGADQLSNGMKVTVGTKT